MKPNFNIEILLSIILIILTILLLNPFEFWMPTPVHMLMLVAMVIVFILFAAFIWKEKAIDERDQMHKAVAGRFAYLIGSIILVLGIIVQSLQHTLDPWLIISLVAMVLAKLAGFIYTEVNN